MNDPHSQKPIRVLLADDHPIFRKTFRELLELEPNIDVILDVADGQAAVEKCLELLPDIVFLDIRMPKLDGLDATRKIKQVRPEIPIICFSMHHEKKFKDAAFEAGASGYLAKSDAVKELHSAIQAVLAGEQYGAR